MTKQQVNISQRNRNKTWKEISGSIHGIPGFVLHHKDVTMKHNNIERYIQWNICDLELMSKSEHMSLHRTGTHHTTATKRKMRAAKLGVPKTEIQKQRMSESHKRYWALRKAELILAEAVPA